MLRKLFIQNLLSLIRSSKLKGNIFLKILVALSLFYLFSIIIAGGLNFEMLLHEIKPLTDPITYFNELNIFILPIFFLALFYFQNNKLPGLSNYMHLPISRDRIGFYYLGVKFFNIVNICILVFFFAFSFGNVLPKYGYFSFVSYISSILLILIFINCLTLLTKILFSKYFISSIIPVLCVILVFVLKFYFKLYPENISAYFFNEVLNRNLILLATIGMMTFAVIILYFHVIKQYFYNLYDDYPAKRLEVQPDGNSVLDHHINAFLLFEIKLILRNRRIRGLFITPVYILFLTYLIFTLRHIDDFSITYFWYLCLTGSWGYAYLQKVFSIDSSFFDFISTIDLDFEKYVKHKYFLIILLSVIICTMALPIILIRSQNIHIIISALLYNISIGYFIVFSTGVLNKERIDLSLGVFYNFQGDNPLQIISITMALILPMVFLSFMTLLLSQEMALTVMDMLCLVSLLFFNNWFYFIKRQFLKRKFKNLESYRR